ncbi:MAG: ATP-binding cassette domain-containing protein, partial [Cryobacterium sp.]
MTAAGIRFDGVSHGFDARPVLHGIDLNLTERRIGIVGANGSGKSTLARIINGLVVPDTGSVTVNGLDVRRQAKL